MVLSAEKADPREDLYIQNLISGMSSYHAGIAAGYSESTAVALQSRKFASERFLAKFARACKGQVMQLLPRLHSATEKQIKHAEKASALIDKQVAQVGDHDPQQAIDLHDRGVSVLKKLDVAQERIAKVTGLIREDKGPTTPPIVSIGEVQNLLLQVSSERVDKGIDVDSV